jgi:hypothetical protein
MFIFHNKLVLRGLFAALIVVSTPIARQVATAQEIAPGIIGDGKHDDTAGLQALLDSGKTEVHMPAAPVCLLIGSPLKIHSNQTVIFDRHTVIHLKENANQIMVTNDDHEKGNENISLIGGIWDMDNLHQALTEYQKGEDHRVRAYDPNFYLGILMRFNRVHNLTIRSLTLKDPVTFGMQLGNLRQFTIEDITFDYNLQRSNMDGVHLHGNCRFGRIVNLKGTTNDDLVALNADDGRCFSLSNGPIEDISVDGVFAENGYTAVRLLSSGSPIRRIQLSNIFGAYRYNVVSLTNHQVHPGEPSTFEDISIRGVFCSKSRKGLNINPSESGGVIHALVWVDGPCTVSSLTIADFHRTEAVWAAETISISPKATIESLQMSNVSLINRTEFPIDVLKNQGTIGCLGMTNVYAKAEGGQPRGAVVRNSGTIRQPAMQQILTDNVSPEIVK